MTCADEMNQSCWSLPYSVTLEEKGVSRLLGIDYGLASKDFPATLSEEITLRRLTILSKVIEHCAEELVLADAATTLRDLGRLLGRKPLKQQSAALTLSNIVCTRVPSHMHMTMD